MLAGIALAFVLADAGAVDIRSLSATSEHGIYILEFNAFIKADFITVRRIATDYDQLHRLSDAIIASRVLPGNEPGTVRRELVTETCRLLFCFEATLVEDVETTGQVLITTLIVPEQSDFSYGRSYWHLSPESGGTVLDFKSIMEPAFWIPPFIGPWLIRKQMRDEVQEIIINIEKQAIHAEE